ncbi:hypothetical protein NPIL_388761 [Nephila pilipes]|uniref:Uncharacterized protein n=1 Tax=Nephila pilipes TaxID=299642 RepID=A0A8X6MPQ9_NEPPI|nr:hypothetical protein NPIL_388761 [Nephila pilipes]
MFHGKNLRGTSHFEPHEKEQKQVSDALRCPGPQAQYNEGDSVCFFPLSRGPANPMKCLRAGDRDCNWPLERGISSRLESLTRADSTNTLYTLPVVNTD